MYEGSKLLHATLGRVERRDVGAAFTPAKPKWRFCGNSALAKGRKNSGTNRNKPADTGLLIYPFFRAVPVQSLVENK